MSTVSWEDARRKARERCEAAGLPTRSAAEKQAATERLVAQVRVYRLTGIDTRRH
ncbi:hypothetical protein [Streptomyces carminius]|uniref:hypothetical protein n=1 Tax=Streptomyces carminius TaxID=2665496 RepID=UPI00130470C8|nr:hypothetical protein [Streptomyces carminius]